MKVLLVFTLIMTQELFSEVDRGDTYSERLFNGDGFNTHKKENKMESWYVDDELDSETDEIDHQRLRDTTKNDKELLDVKWVKIAVKIYSFISFNLYNFCSLQN